MIIIRIKQPRVAVWVKIPRQKRACGLMVDVATRHKQKEARSLFAATEKVRLRSHDEIASFGPWPVSSQLAVITCRKDRWPYHAEGESKFPEAVHFIPAFDASQSAVLFDFLLHLRLASGAELVALAGQPLLQMLRLPQ